MNSKLLILSLSALSLFATNASAQSDGGDFEPGIRVGAHFAMTATGTATAKVDGTKVSEADLEPGFGGALRFEYAMLKYLSLGAQLGYLSIQNEIASNANMSRASVAEFDLLVRGTYPIDMGSMELRPYVAIPVGLTLFNSGTTKGAEDPDSEVGFNVAFMGGLEVKTEALAGLSPYLEVGYHIRQVPIGDADVSLNQLAFNVGAAYQF